MHGDCDENLLKMISELLRLVKELREEVNSQRGEVQYLRTLLENCAGCREAQPIIKSGCQYENPCFPGVTCHDTPSGPRCGRCPRGYVGDGKSCRVGVTCEDNPCYRLESFKF
jgi:syndecan 4